MFSIFHFIWLAICVVLIVFGVSFYSKKRPAMKDVLTVALVISILSELTKVFNVIQMVPSTDGTLIGPYISLNHLPLHFCSIQILLITFVRFTDNEKQREKVLAFMTPTCIIGGIMALAMPSIFTTSISVSQAFTSPLSYQFFIFHSMLISLGFIIIKSDTINWQKRHFTDTIILVYILGFVSIYINSMFASPTYVDGQLISVDFWPNFFFTYQNPLGIRLTEKWQWMAYLALITVLAYVLIYLFFLPLIKGAKKKAASSN